MKQWFIFTLFLFLIAPISGFAVSFDKNNIISDADLTNYNSMSLSRVENFLDNQGGMLANYRCLDVDNQNRSAGEIIYNAAQRYFLSPKFLIATIQKESSLITRTSASEHLLDYALGYGCPDGSACSPEYAGFAKQVNAAANNIRNGYLSDLEDHNSTIAGWGVGRTKQALDGTVTPANKATAVLYTYTPWIGYYGGNANYGGNSLFWDIWQRWFPSSNYIIKYPNGSLLQSKETGIIYLIKKNSKNAFTSYGAFVSSYNINRVISVGEDVLSQYKDGYNIYFPNGSLLQSPEGGIYLYINSKKRAITSSAIFRQLGYNPEEVIPAKWAELKKIPDGPNISEAETYPGGVLFQDINSGAVFYIDNKKIRHPIYHKDILTTSYSNLSMMRKTTDEINDFKLGKPCLFKDGELVTSKSNKSVFIIENGLKRPFQSAKAFKKLGYKFSNVITTEDNILKMHKTGKSIGLKNK